VADLYVGVMSGTSLDGADVVLVDLAESGIHLLARRNTLFPSQLRRDLEQIIVDPVTSSQTLAGLDRQLGHFYADAVLQLLDHAGRNPEEILAIGNHGQTVFHDPDSEYPATLQLGDPSTIAAATGITTVAHFRQLDIAHGGQGAPLACAFHQRFLASPDESRAVVNIGGIANVTLLRPGEPVLGFDTGPGNTLMDIWHRLQGRGAFDDQGRWAASGQIHTGLLEALLADAYFGRSPPKSTGRELFNLEWLSRSLAAMPAIASEDVQATLAELTAVSIARALEGTRVQRILACGGGVHNRHLLERLDALTGAAIVQTTDDWGIPADWLEAMAFAWLAHARLKGIPGNVPSVTGARREAVLGGVYSCR
jgi:anhydro-N-acetylmuramic acid kinase